MVKVELQGKICTEAKKEIKLPIIVRRKSSLEFYLITEHGNYANHGRESKAVWTRLSPDTNLSSVVSYVEPLENVQPQIENGEYVIVEDARLIIAKD